MYTTVFWSQCHEGVCTYKLRVSMLFLSYCLQCTYVYIREYVFDLFQTKSLHPGSTEFLEQLCPLYVANVFASRASHQ